MIKLIKDRILVQPIEVIKETKSGLYIPESASEGLVKGKVTAVGDGKVTKDGRIIQLHVCVGDTVLYSKGTGSVFKMEGIDYLILTEDQILATI